GGRGGGGGGKGGGEGGGGGGGGRAGRGPPPGGPAPRPARASTAGQGQARHLGRRAACPRQTVKVRPDPLDVRGIPPGAVAFLPPCGECRLAPWDSPAWRRRRVSERVNAAWRTKKRPPTAKKGVHQWPSKS